MASELVAYAICALETISRRYLSLMISRPKFVEDLFNIN